MRRYPLPPPAMWPCERPLVHVLNGDYPAADLRRMSLPGLERLVSKLVQRTSKPAARPKWWPNDLVFTHPIDLGLRNEREIKLAFKQLIVSCCQFFKTNERRRRRASSKHQFLHYLRLQERRRGESLAAAAPPPPAPAKLATCINIPFSSDVGRLMAAREQHTVSEGLKMRRLERCEWYTNRDASRGAAGVDFEVAACKQPSHSHLYKMPKRQQHHKRRSLHDAEFLANFCTPVSVVLTRLDLNKIQSLKKKELLVMIKDKEKMCCDLKSAVNVNLVPLSPKFGNV